MTMFPVLAIISKYPVGILLKPDRDRSPHPWIDTYLERLMAPYDDGLWPDPAAPGRFLKNPAGRWDWWEVAAGRYKQIFCRAAGCSHLSAEIPHPFWMLAEVAAMWQERGLPFHTMVGEEIGWCTCREYIPESRYNQELSPADFGRQVVAVAARYPRALSVILTCHI